MFPEMTKGLIDPVSASAEPFRVLRLAIELRPDVRRRNALVVTSARQGDGKSIVAANYALVCALTNSRVLLIDGDLRNPAQHKIFGVPRSPGLVDLFRDRLSLGAVTHSIASSPGTLDVLPAGSAMPRVGDIPASPQMASLLEEAGRQYDIVVVDSSPVLGAADAAALASHAGTDTVVVVPRTGRRRHLVHALRRLELTDANVLGLVVNREGRLATYAY